MDWSERHLVELSASEEQETTDESALFKRFQAITTWKRAGERAPHKPLLILIALARIQRREPRLIAFEEIESLLRRLLVDFGPPRKSYHPEYPFWRLQNDGLWDIPQSAQLLEQITARKRKGDVPPRILKAHRAHGGFPKDVYESLASQPDIVNRLAVMVLNQNFPFSFHEEILDAVGMPWVVQSKKTPRDPGFRDTILRIYEHRCAICGYDGRLGQIDLGLEAAHVKWHAAGGPDRKENGLALCVFHHQAIDRGAIGLSDEKRILISQDVHGGPSVDEWLITFSGRPLLGPQSGEPSPANTFIHWHRKQVFREPPRAG